MSFKNSAKLIHVRRIGFVFTLACFGCGTVIDTSRNQNAVTIKEMPSAITVANSSADESQNNQLTPTKAMQDVDVSELWTIKRLERRHKFAIEKAKQMLSMDLALSERERNPENYICEVKRHSEFIFVYFRPKDSDLPKYAGRDGGGQTELGRDVVYFVTNDGKRVVGRFFFE